MKYFATISGNLLNISDSEVISSSLWALSYMSDGDTNWLNLIMQNINVKVVIDFLSNENQEISSPAIRMIGNIASGSEEQVNQILQAGGLDVLKNMINKASQSPMIVKECCWVISNIAAGTPNHVQQILDKDFAKMLSLIVKSTPNFPVEKNH